jgi:hypothetical protein
VMAATMTTSADLSSSTGIEQHMRSREELAEQLAVLRLGSAAAAARAWRQPGAPDVDQDQRQESLLERFERVTGPAAGERLPGPLRVPGRPGRRPGVSAPLEPDQLAALRALRRGFGDVQVLEVVEGDDLLEQLRKYPAGTLATLRERSRRDPAPVQAEQAALFDH